MSLCMYSGNIRYFGHDLTRGRVRAEPQPLTSLLWRHRVTWRHQWRHHSILPGLLPVVNNLLYVVVSETLGVKNEHRHVRRTKRQLGIHTPAYRLGNSKALRERKPLPGRHIEFFESHISCQITSRSLVSVGLQIWWTYLKPRPNYYDV